MLELSIYSETPFLLMKLSDETLLLPEETQGWGCKGICLGESDLLIIHILF